METNDVVKREDNRKMIDDITKPALIENLNTKFRMQLDSGAVELELISVTDLSSSARNEQFSAVFRGPVDGPLYQTIFNLEHETLGSFALFLVPIGKDQNGIEYEAVFNRFITHE
jgi:uncharacterized protein DUF6916